MSRKQKQQIWKTAFAVAFVFVVINFGTGCRVANEYGTQDEAIQTAATRKSELAAIGELDRNFGELWRREEKLNQWKESALPVIENAGATTAQLLYRSRNLNPRKLFSSKMLLSKKPRSEITQGGGGWVPVPARYAISGSYRGTVVSSRGRASLYGQEHTLYAYDFFGEESDYWLRVVFWDPPPPVGE